MQRQKDWSPPCLCHTVLTWTVELSLASATCNNDMSLRQQPCSSPSCIWTATPAWYCVSAWKRGEGLGFWDKAQCGGSIVPLLRVGVFCSGKTSGLLFCQIPKALNSSCSVFIKGWGFVVLLVHPY